MNLFASAVSEHPDTAEAAGETLGQIAEALEGERPDLVLTFFSPHHLSDARNIATALHEVLAPRATIGASVAGVIADGRDIEAGPSISVWAAVLPGLSLRTMLLETLDTPAGGEVTGWPDSCAGPGTLLVLADPFSFPLDRFLASLNVNLPDIAVAGGFASAGVAPGVNRLIADMSICSAGAVGVLIEPSAKIRCVLTQGSRPVGNALTVTKADAGVIYELGGRPALERLEETFNRADAESKRLMTSRMQIGTVVNEQQDEFGPGDFLVRDIVVADTTDKSITAGEIVEVGQTVQFHVSDSAAAARELARYLATGSEATPPAATLIFAHMGLGVFGAAGAEELHEALALSAVSGAICAGVAGSVGGAGYVHPGATNMVLFSE